MVPSWAYQLLPQLLMEQFDTLPIQYRLYSPQTLFVVGIPVFCRGRDPARISRKFQQSRSQNTLVANLVMAEFS